MAKCETCSFQGDIPASKDHVRKTGHVVDAYVMKLRPGPEDGPAGSDRQDAAREAPRPQNAQTYGAEFWPMSPIREIFVWIVASVAVSALLSAVLAWLPFFVIFVPLQLIYLALMFFRIEKRKSPEARILPRPGLARCQYCGKRIGGLKCPNCGAEQ